MRALVTNDDGVGSDGLLALARAAASRGMQVTVVAPSFDASGSSAALTATAREGKVLVESLDEGEVTVLSVQGPPAFIVRAAVYGAFGSPPDVVLSGVNRGRNTGRAVLHSGTVGAALTAASYGRRGLAVSADVSGEGDWDLDPHILGEAVDWVLHSPLTTVLNVNLPLQATGGFGSARGVRSTSLAESGTVQGNVSDVTGDYLPVTFADEQGEAAEGTDVAALKDGYVSVTAIQAVTEDSRLDVDRLLLGAARSRN